MVSSESLRGQTARFPSLRGCGKGDVAVIVAVAVAAVAAVAAAAMV